jgi:hypothetical protein
VDARDRRRHDGPSESEAVAALRPKNHPARSAADSFLAIIITGRTPRGTEGMIDASLMTSLGVIG